MPPKDEFREMYERRLDEETLENLETVNEVARMKKGLDTIGHGGIWELIESMSNCKTRTTMRRYFFEAGGIIPLQEKTI